MLLQPREDYEARALARVPQALRGKPRFEAFVRGLAAPFQEVDGALVALLASRQLATATHAALDVLGRVVGAERLGLDDEVFRQRIRQRLALNRGSGEAERVLLLFRLLTPLALELREEFPAAFTLHVGGGALARVTEFASLLRQAKAGGVRALLEYQPATDADTFAFADSGGAGMGFAGLQEDALGARGEVVPSPPRLGPTVEVENGNGSVAPTFSLAVGGVPAAGVYRVEVLDTAPDWTLQWFLDEYFQGTGVMYPGGADEVPVPLFLESGADSGLAVAWPEGEPYVSGDSWQVTVEDAPEAPQLSLVAPLAASLRVVVEVVGGAARTFRYSLDGGVAWSAATGMGTGLVPLLSSGAPSSAAVQWEDSTGYADGASWAWNAVRASPAGGRLSGVMAV
ncbi:hypothetical protein JYJ95_37930 [Corallococcus exiguus]|uniref:hypothetical protein n=1 Tax=Corallococcus exiguus TaxID=83462 RepID=UPI001A8E8093|nr:hypothetical protein [Corallococcus exiguus]MBN8472317.1 hypothetical protein [Corallococcus exiguus]